MEFFKRFLQELFKGVLPEFLKGFLPEFLKDSSQLLSRDISKYSRGLSVIPPAILPEFSCKELLKDSYRIFFFDFF